MTPAEWNTVWRLKQSSRARSALMQEIGAWQMSRDEAGAAGSLGDRPLAVLTGENFLPSGRQTVWIGFQTALAQLSTRGKLVRIDESHEDLIYRAPEAIITATRQVVEDVRQVRKLR